MQLKMFREEKWSFIVQYLNSIKIWLCQVNCHTSMTLWKLFFRVKGSITENRELYANYKFWNKITQFI